MTAAVREVLGHVDSVVTDNAAPLRSLITNLAAFADALGRNSTHVDGIVAGLERLTGGGAKATPAVYELAAARHLPRLREAGHRSARRTRADRARCAVDRSDPRARFAGPHLDRGRREMERPAAARAPGAACLQSFENAGLMRQASRPLDGLNADFQLVTEIHEVRPRRGPLTRRRKSSFRRGCSAPTARSWRPRSSRSEEPAKGDGCGRGCCGARCRLRPARDRARRLDLQRDAGRHPRLGRSGRLQVRPGLRSQSCTNSHTRRIRRGLALGFLAAIRSSAKVPPCSP